MRKLFLLLFSALLVCCFVGCDQDAEPKVAAVSFDANGATGRVPSTINVRIGKSFSVPSKGSLEKRGYDFAGWNTSPSGNGTQFASYRSGTANEDMTLYAQWKIHTYNIEYDYMYGELPPEEWNRSSYTVDTESFQLANPTREGFEFLGWKLYGSDDSTAKKNCLVEKGSVGDLHFVAVWRQLSSWTVSYNANGGNGWVTSQTKYEGGVVTILDASTIERKGYGFVCWNTKEDGSGVDYNPNDTYDKDDSLSLYAQWEILEYSIKYDLTGGFFEGAASNPDAYTVESASFALKNPVKEGHVFLGWKNAGSADSTAKSSFVFEKGSYGDCFLVAVWRTLKELTISFYVNAASSEDAYSFVKVMEGESFVIPSGEGLSRDGYDFAAWDTRSSGNGTKYEPSQEIVVDCDLKLYAQWTLHNYSIYYDLAGGYFPVGLSVPDHYTIETRTFALNEPSKNGSSFLGWKPAGSNDSSANKSFSIEKGSYGDLSFVAVWGHVISYDSNGGEGNLESQTKLEGATLTLATAEGFSRDGYEFDCWNTKADGSGTNYQQGDVFDEDRDVTLYAKWTLVSYPITYNFNGGYLTDGSFNLNSYTIETDTFALANPKRNGDWTFIGWKLSGDEDKTAQEFVKIQKGSTGAKSFVAVWGHYVSYNINGGYGEVKRQIKYEKTPLILASLEGLSRKGYSIETWNTSPDGSGTNYNPSSMFNGDRDMVLYAKWDIEHYGISYELDGGLLPDGLENPLDYTVETPTFELNAPEKDGYKFLGWKLAGSDDSTSNPDIKIARGSTGDKSYVAVWQPLNSCWVQYVANGGSGSVGRQIKYEGVPLAISDVTGLSRDGYDFVCWNTSANGSGTDYKPGDLYRADSNLTLYAQWRIVSYKIGYDLDGGALPAGCSNPVAYTMESESFTLVNPSKEGYEFLGWKIVGYSDSTASKTVSIEKGSLGAKAFVAVWRQLNRYEVTYNANGGTGSIESQSKLEGHSLIVSNPLNIARTGYSFKEWNTKADGSGESYNPGDSYNVDQDLVLYAKWSAVQYLISYNLDGGILPVGSSNPISYTIEYDSFTLNNPTKAGYVFLGWKLSGFSNSTAQKVFEIEKGSVGNKSLIAVWRQLNEYTISYNVNGGSGSVPSQTKLEGASIAIAEPEGISRNGYMFACWNTMLDGSGKSYNPNDIFSSDYNLNLYAEWDIVKYSISYDLGDGTIPTGYDNPKEYDVETDTIILVNPERLGYKFIGWKEFGSADETAEENVSIAKGSTGNKFFVAVWKQLKKYVISYDSNGGTGFIPSQTMYEGDIITISPAFNISRSGYEFVCWNTEPDGSGTDYQPLTSRGCQNVKLYAKWRILTYEIEYDLAGGVIEGENNPSTYTVEKDTFTLSNPVKEGYRFLGWKVFGSADETALESIEIKKGSTGNKFFIAVWRQLAKYTISYDANGGTGSIPSQTKYEGDLVVLQDSNGLEREGFQFTSWNTSSDGSGMTFYPDDVYTDDGNLSLYAIWIEDPLTYTYLPETDSYSVTCSDKTISSVVIPSVHKGKPVTEIGAYAFDEFSSLISVEMPLSLTAIGKCAFWGCRGLTGSLTIPDGVTDIGACAFEGCSGLTGNLIIPKGVTNINDDVFRGCSGLTGSLIIPEGVTNIGAYAFSGCSGLTGSLIIPEVVTSIGEYAFSKCSGLTGDLIVPDGVTTIGVGAFSECSGLTGSLAIPNGVTTIEAWVFSGCSGLTGNLTIPDGVTSIEVGAFKGCTGLSGSLTMPNGVVCIGDRAFQGCSSLSGDLRMSENLKSIGEYAFHGCNGLTGELRIPNSVTIIDDFTFCGCSGFSGSLFLPAEVTSIGDGAFSGCSGLTGSLTIPDSVTVIGGSAFYNCSGLTGNLVIPDEVTIIGDCAFSGCSGLSGDLIIPNGVIYIGRRAFGDCSGLTGALTIPDGVTTINERAFAGCSGLTGSLIIPDNVTSIEESAFEGCSGLTGSLIIPDNVTSIGEYAFSKCSGLTGNLKIPESVISIGVGAFYCCSSLTGSLTIPEGVTSISSLSFNGCRGLTGRLVIPSGVTSIGSSAFNCCSGLTGSLEIPDGVTSIGNHAFADCSGLTGSLKMPGKVKNIGNFAFYNCQGLTRLTFSGIAELSTIGDYAFNRCRGLTSIDVPKGVTDIGEGAFLGCNSLTNINYEESISRWNAITKRADWDFGTPNYTIHFSDGTTMTKE